MSNEFDVDLDLDLGEPKQAPAEVEVEAKEAAPAAKAKGKTKPKKAAAESESEAVEEVKKADKPYVDPEFDRANWPSIIIDHEEGKSNYEFVSAHGTTKDGAPFGWDMQIMRGVEVKVPPSIVYNLQDAVSTHYPTVLDPVTKEKRQLKQNRSAIPWTLVSRGKYL